MSKTLHFERWRTGLSDTSFFWGNPCSCSWIGIDLIPYHEPFKTMKFPIQRVGTPEKPGEIDHKTTSKNAVLVVSHVFFYFRLHLGKMNPV